MPIEKIIGDELAQRLATALLQIDDRLRLALIETAEKLAAIPALLEAAAA